MNDPSPNTARWAGLAAALALPFALGACNALDPYADKF